MRDVGGTGFAGLSGQACAMSRLLNAARRNAVASLALAIALGGGSAYAAAKLPASSVGARQLKNGAVTSAKVRDGSLTAADFKKGVLPKGAGVAGQAGALGSQGSNGAPGAPGASGANGDAGATGAAGPSGPAGVPGPIGPQGDSGPAGPLLTVLPAGATLRGEVYDFGTDRRSAFVSFPVPLATAPTVVSVAVGGPPTANCPGTAAEPSAKPGFLCLYYMKATNNGASVTWTLNPWQTTRFGTGLAYTGNQYPTEFGATWAVTG